MSLWDRKRERFIRKVLQRLSRQRVEVILPGGVWVINHAVTEEEDVVEAVRTCHMRGWVEPLCNAIPQGRLTADGKLPEGELFSGVGPMYRLTEAGWSVIHRLHTWVVITGIIALITLISTVVGLVVALTR
ncbi:hypothetical protein KAR02_07335 [Candidatus Bipolaricaulota bacterium]|nr:hypothetical protein [Candidatus Bipolaricaulota bacterium]